MANRPADRGRLIGAALCLGSLVLTITFIWGIAAGAYWAIAIPVAMAVVLAMSLLFWVGWTFLTSEPPPRPAEREEPRPYRR